MSEPSTWLLTRDAVRFITPAHITRSLAAHPLGRALYPTSAGFYPVARGHTMRRREHDDCLLLYCVNGQAEVEALGTTSPVGPGDLLCFLPGVRHAYRAIHSDPWTVYWTHFTGVQAAAYLRHAGLSRQQVLYHVGVRAALVSDFQSLLDARRNAHDLPAALQAAHGLRQLLCRLGAGTAPSAPSRSQLQIDRVQALMLRQLDGALRLDELAAAARLSRFQFAHEYQRQTGVSPIAHFIRLKMERATQLLDTTDLSVKEVAAALGYSDAYYFSRVFKKIVGFAPDRYRRLNRG
jgi:AraC-like DNA-binding protein